MSRDATRPNIPPHVADLIAAYYPPGSDVHTMFLVHGLRVAEKALDVAHKVRLLRPGSSPDVTFIQEAALLHDIGIFLTNAPELCCHGADPYLRHGVLGRDLLDRHGLPRHALVCERHVGVGIAARDIRIHGLPLPERDMIPETLEERIIAYADKFFSKDCRNVWRENAPHVILAGLARHGEDQPRIFREWMREFGEEPETTEAEPCMGGRA